MAEPIQLHTPQPPTSEPAGAAGGGEGKRPAARKKRSPTMDSGNLERLWSFAYEYGSDIAWDCDRLKPYKISGLRHTFGHDVVKFWMASPRRRMVYAEHVVFEPGAALAPEWLNLFSGLPSAPEPGDCSVMLELLHHLCSASYGPDGIGPEEIADWVLRWCAYPLQHLGEKLDTALVFHGPQGTGKNLFFDVLRDLYGDYGVMVGQTEIEDKYNAWLSRRMLIVGDEVVSRQEMYHAKNRLKWIITQRTKIPIRAMQMDTRWESNHANLVFLSNENQPLALEEGDRRFLVVYTPKAERGDLYQRVRTFLENGGAAKWLNHLLTIPLEGFTPHSKPLMTAAKTSLIEAGYDPSQRFAHEWLSGLLPLPMRVCSAEQLYRAARRWADQNGERFLPQQAKFTTTVNRLVSERDRLDANGRLLPPQLDYKVVQLKVNSEGGAGRKAVRCWIPEGCRPPQGVTEGEWAAEAVQSFEKDLADFLRHDRRSEDLAA